MYDKVNLVSEKSRLIAKKLFPSDSEKIIDRLQYLCEIGVDFDRMARPEYRPTPEQWERVCFSVLKASDCSKDEFERVVKYAMYDIKEVFPIAGFEESLTIHRQWGDKILNN
jgi:hypothetical protein